MGISTGNGTNKSKIGDHRLGEPVGGYRAFVLAFNAPGSTSAVSNTRIFNRDTELQAAIITLVKVEIVVSSFVNDQVMRANSATEKLNTIIAAIRYLHVMHLGATTYTAQGQAVDLFVFFNRNTGIFNAHIVEFTRVVGII